VTRLVDPLGLVARGSTWYLIAGVEGELRTYRVSRVEDVEITDEACRRPDGFDLAAHWEASKEAFRERLPRYPVTVRAVPDIVARLRVSGRYARVTAEAQAPDEGGWVRLELLFEVDWEACEYLLSFGSAVEVLEPPELRRQIAQRAAETVRLYAGDHERLGELLGG
jgi:predicted DNA-binding transcriptional regulator YafY